MKRFISGDGKIIYALDNVDAERFFNKGKLKFNHEVLTDISNLTHHDYIFRNNEIYTLNYQYPHKSKTPYYSDLVGWSARLVASKGTLIIVNKTDLFMALGDSRFMRLEEYIIKTHEVNIKDKFNLTKEQKIKSLVDMYKQSSNTKVSIKTFINRTIIS